jgi:hypothetical protein
MEPFKTTAAAKAGNSVAARLIMLCLAVNCLMGAFTPLWPAERLHISEANPSTSTVRVRPENSAGQSSMQIGASPTAAEVMERYTPTQGRPCGHWMMKTGDDPRRTTQGSTAIEEDKPWITSAWRRDAGSLLVEAECKRPTQQIQDLPEICRLHILSSPAGTQRIASVKEIVLYMKGDFTHAAKRILTKTTKTGFHGTRETVFGFLFNEKSHFRRRTKTSTGF